MGKLLSGINGPFSGKVGPVVGYLLGNQAVIRGLPVRRKGPLSPLQLQQQAKFRLMHNFLNQLISLLNLTYGHLAVNMTGYNKAFSYNVKNAIMGVHPELKIDYPMVLLGRGDLPNAESPTVVTLPEGKIIFSWTDNSGKGSAKAGDKAFVAVFNEELNDWEYELNLATRAGGSCTLDTPILLKDKPVHSYIGFISADGKDVTDTAYTGVVSFLQEAT